MAAQVFLDGSVYSPVDPFATALVMNEGAVEWVGQDAGARSILDESMQSIELGGALVVPTFSLAAAAVSSVEDAKELLSVCRSQGYGEVNLFSKHNFLSEDATGSELKINTYLSAEALLNPSELPTNIKGVYFTEDSLKHLSLLTVAVEHQLIVSGAFTTSSSVKVFLDKVSSLEPLDRLRIAPRLDGIFSLEDDLIDVARSLHVTLGFSSDYASAGDSLSRALSSGAAVTLGSDPLAKTAAFGWDLVSDAVNAPEHQAISARAAFQALTRGVQRANGVSSPLGGQLVPGAPANFALWNVTELMVQTPDSRISAWSTDPRARTPLLPALSPDVDRPVLSSVYLEGKALKNIGPTELCED